ncbi:unnamed protein product [Citrullus colocynthis]|uniref:Uncharacterized protein n=1 Tax=Citrullus colocynthis TaxID=252529 RepID=A0ABP0XMB6_9ROSI
MFFTTFPTRRKNSSSTFRSFPKFLSRACGEDFPNHNLFLLLISWEKREGDSSTFSLFFSFTFSIES